MPSGQSPKTNRTGRRKPGRTSKGLMSSASVIVNTRGGAANEVEKRPGQHWESVCYCWRLLRQEANIQNKTPKQWGGQSLSRSTDLTELMEVRRQEQTQNRIKLIQGILCRYVFKAMAQSVCGLNRFQSVSGGFMARKDNSISAG